MEKVTAGGPPTLLDGVSAGVPLTFVAVALAMVALALAAGAVSTRAAARVDPLDALRAE